LYEIDDVNDLNNYNTNIWNLALYRSSAYNKMENEVLKTIETAVANNCGAMGADTISKNGRMSKSQMSRRKY